MISIPSLFFYDKYIHNAVDQMSQAEYYPLVIITEQPAVCSHMGQRLILGFGVQPIFIIQKLSITSTILQRTVYSVSDYTAYLRLLWYLFHFQPEALYMTGYILLYCLKHVQLSCDINYKNTGL